MLDDQLNINVLVAGRPYKLKVEAGEEGIVRQAAKNVNDKVQEYQQQFFTKDKQDFLAMIALQTGVEALKPKNNNEGDSQFWAEKLDALNDLLDQHLEEHPLF
jgi:cell division protein ZapA